MANKKQLIKQLVDSFQFISTDAQNLKKILVAERMKAKRSAKPKYSRQILIVSKFVLIGKLGVRTARQVPKAIR